jgi:hypothetical protein
VYFPTNLIFKDEIKNQLKKLKEQKKNPYRVWWVNPPNL